MSCKTIEEYNNYLIDNQIVIEITCASALQGHYVAGLTV